MDFYLIIKYFCIIIFIKNSILYMTNTKYFNYITNILLKNIVKS